MTISKKFGTDKKGWNFYLGHQGSDENSHRWVICTKENLEIGKEIGMVSGTLYTLCRLCYLVLGQDYCGEPFYRERFKNDVLDALTAEYVPLTKEEYTPMEILEMAAEEIDWEFEDGSELQLPSSCFD